MIIGFSEFADEPLSRKVYVLFNSFSSIFVMGIIRSTPTPRLRVSRRNIGNSIASAAKTSLTKCLRFHYAEHLYAPAGNHDVAAHLQMSCFTEAVDGLP